MKVEKNSQKVIGSKTSVEINPKTKKKFSLGEEMINQGIETIEFVLGNASIHFDWILSISDFS